MVDKPPVIEFLLVVAIVALLVVLTALILTSLPPAPDARSDRWGEVADDLGARDALLCRSQPREIKSARFASQPRRLVVTLDTGEQCRGGPYERTPRRVGLRRVELDGRDVLVVAVEP